MKKEKWYEFDPLKSFMSLPILWVTVGSISLIALAVGIVIATNSSLSLSLDYQGINNFVSIFKVPLGIFALIIPIVAMIAANHRSEQTKSQILSGSQQNTFANYYKHIEEFEKYVVNHLQRKNCIRTPRKVHRALFPNAAQGELRINNETSQFIEKICLRIIESARHFANGHPYTQADTIVNIDNEVNTLESKLCIDWQPQQSGGGYRHNGQTIHIPNDRLISYFSELKGRLNLIKDLTEFDQSYEPPSSLTLIAEEMKLDQIPSDYKFQGQTLEQELNATGFSMFPPSPS